MEIKMQVFNSFSSLLYPIYLITVFAAWSLWKKEKWLGPTLLALSFSSGAIIFLLVREHSNNYGNFEIGFLVGMHASTFVTLPLAAIGWHLGKKLNIRLAIILTAIAFLLNLLGAFSYQYLIKRNAENLKKEVTLDCAKLPYHCAIRDHKLDEIPNLKKKGMNIEARDSQARTALWYSINNQEAVKILLENKANPESFNDKSETPLAYVMVISLNPNLPIAKLLLEHGAQINRTIGFRKKISILNFAIINKNIDVINFALENGADPFFIDSYKKSACERLSKMPSEKIINLKKYCPTLN